MQYWKAQNVSSLRIFYNGLSNLSTFSHVVSDNPDYNTPAANQWFLSLTHTLLNETDEKVINIAFLPDGSIDFNTTSANDLGLVNNLLQSLSDFAASRTAEVVDIWKVLNALFVGSY